MSIFKITYTDNDGCTYVEMVVAETMVKALQCFERVMDLDATKCELVEGYDGVLVDLK